ncbi:MAG: hypothetical protein HDS11_02885 [Bacteroides sp.]|nr:hypothetical protein [Bacteroides sp.]
MIIWETRLTKDILANLTLEDGRTAMNFIISNNKSLNMLHKFNYVKLNDLNKELVKSGYESLSSSVLSKQFGNIHINSTVLYGFDTDGDILEKIVLSQADLMNFIAYSQILKSNYDNQSISTFLKVKESNENKDLSLLTSISSLTLDDIDFYVSIATELILNNIHHKYLDFGMNWDVGTIDDSYATIPTFSVLQSNIQVEVY